MRFRLVVSTLLVCAACGGEASGPSGGGGPSVRIVAGGTGTDTITAILPQVLTVEVIDASGRPSAGRLAEFEVVPVKNDPPLTGEYQLVGLAGPGGTVFAGQGSLATDANGRASFRVRFGERVGEGIVRIRVPEVAPAQSLEARYTVMAGAGDHVVLAPTDSAVYVGDGYRLSGHLADRGGNTLTSAPLTFSIASGGATIDASGSVVATAVGRVRITAQADGKSGTAWMSVPPRATVASLEPDGLIAGPVGIFLLGLDGSARTPLSVGIVNSSSGQGFGWYPDGRDLVISRGDSIDVITSSGLERRVLSLSTPLPLGVRYSRDGAWIYFSIGGSGLARVRSDLEGEIQNLGYLVDGDWRPSPSHDGLSVAYTSRRTPCGVEDCIRVLELATGEDRSYPGGRDWLVRGHQNAWSPVEDVVAYASDFPSDVEVGLVRSDGTEPRVLANDIRSVNWMDFSPDGKWLLVASSSTPLTLFEVATGARLPLATLPNSQAAAWRP